jgi:hypothetical protein
MRSVNGPSSGQVRVYYWNTSISAWTQRGLDIYGEAWGDQCGYSVSLSADGNTLAIGSPFHNNNSGQVRVYYYIDEESIVTSNDLGFVRGTTSNIQAQLNNARAITFPITAPSTSYGIAGQIVVHNNNLYICTQSYVSVSTPATWRGVSIINLLNL